MPLNVIIICSYTSAYIETAYQLPAIVKNIFGGQIICQSVDTYIVCHNVIYYKIIVDSTIISIIQRVDREVTYWHCWHCQKVLPASM